MAHSNDAGELFFVILLSPNNGRYKEWEGSISIMFDLQFNREMYREMYIWRITGFFKTFLGFFNINSFDLYGLKRSVLSFRSSRCRVFRKEAWPNLYRPRPILDLGAKIIS